MSRRAPATCDRPTIMFPDVMRSPLFGGRSRGGLKPGFLIPTPFVRLTLSQKPGF
ncbi:MAG: hypothetical protein AB4352_04905 [Hormoscilla sp.]